MSENNKAEPTISDVIKLLEGIKQQNDQTQEEIRQYKQTIENKFEENFNRIKSLEEENKKLSDELQTTQRKLKRNNFLIFGLEPVENLLESVAKFIQEKLEVEMSRLDFNNVYAIGDKIIIVELVTYLKKREIFSNLHKLKGTNISFSHDLTKKAQTENKLLVKNLKEAKSKKLNAKIVNHKLIINGEVFTYENLKEKQEAENIEEVLNSTFQDSINNIKSSLSLKRKAESSLEDTTVRTIPETRQRKNSRK